MSSIWPFDYDLAAEVIAELTAATGPAIAQADYISAETSMSNPTQTSSSHSLDAVTIVTQRRVACDGGGGALGHPKVWMDMGQDNTVECKYCDRVFALDPNAADDGHH